ADRSTAAARLRLVLGWRQRTAVIRTTMYVTATRALWAGQVAATSLLRTIPPEGAAALVLVAGRAASQPGVEEVVVIRQATAPASSARPGRKATTKQRATAAIQDLTD